MEYPISALVVDDESSTRKILTDYINWKELGINKVYDADHGRSGLEIALAVKPQIIISDIKMPYMDGIEFAEHIRKVMPDCKFVFLSGYADKNYLKSAIKLKATNFIEKPINLEEISTLIKDLVSECIKDNEEANKLMDFSDQQLIFNTTSHVYSDQIISSLIRKKPYFNTSGATFIVSTINFGLPVDSPRFTLYKEIIEKQFLKEQCIIGIRNSKIFVVIHALSDIDYSTFTHKLSTGIEEITSAYTDANIFASCDLPINTLTLLKDSYTRALDGLSKCFFTGKNKLYIPDLMTSSSYQLDQSIFSQFEESFTSDEQHMAENTLQQLVLDITKHQDTSHEYIKNIFYQLTFLLVNMMEHRNLCFNFNSFDVLEKISKSETLAEIKSEFLDAIRYCFKCSTIANKESEDPGLRINSFLQANYENPDLSIDYIAQNLNFAPSYLCSVFKKTTGKTINQYLTILRIEQAKELLTFSNKKLYEIGRSVGYKDGKYFTKVFAKITGISPKQYRERDMDND